MKRTYKKLICVILSAVLLLSALPMTVHAAADTYSVSTPQELRDAVTAINSAKAGEYTISLAADIYSEIGGIGIGSIERDYTGTVVTIIGNGHSLTCASGQNVQAWNGAKVILGDGETELTLIGDTSGVNNSNPGIVYIVDKDSVGIMNDKVTLKNNMTDTQLGAGVTVQGGTFTMNGGTIENCGVNSGSISYGGGVGVFVGGSFIMNGGTIKDCYTISSYKNDNDDKDISSCGAGVFVSSIASFTMNGGTICNNTATNTGGGISCGGGVALIISNNEMADYAMGNPQSSVTINGGTITGNKADLGGGVFASGYYKSYVNGLGTDTPGGGTPKDPGLYISGGEISENEAGEGGGIFAMCLCPWTRGNKGKGSKTQIHNVKINNNTADTGAGIESYAYWTQMDIDGCTITGNEADSNGGGIALIGNSSSGFTKLSNSTITDNTSGDRGAGVYYDAASRLNISGANTIQDNTFIGTLNNLNIFSLENPVYVTGNLTGSQIGLSDPTLWDDGKSDIDDDAISTERLTIGYKANNASLIPADAFTSDHESWIVNFGEKKTEQVEIGRTYSYTADKYVTDPAMTEGYPIAEGGYIRLKAKTYTGKPENTTDIYNELVARYGEEYELKTDLGTNAFGDEHIYYDSRSDKYITIYKYGNSVVYIWVGSLSNVINCNFNTCDNVLISGVSYQQYGKNGELVLGVYRQRYPGAEPEVFSESGIALEYDEALDFEGEDIYEDYYLNDLGIISSKLVINKSSEVVDIQYDTITTDYTNEVRLVRKTTVDYHINNQTIADAKYQGEDIFTSYVAESTGEIKIGDTIKAFYTVPEVTPTAQNSCPYIFKGWYYDKANNNDTRPVNFGTDQYTAGRDIYAHWIEVKNVAQDKGDEYSLPEGETEYGGFDLTGVQVRGAINDTNFDGIRKPGGLRFMTSLSTDVVNEIKALQDGDNNIEYGYVAATRADWITAHQNNGDKLQYVSRTANGKNTSTYDKEKPQDYFGFATNVNCTSQETNASDGIVPQDHRKFSGYLLYTLVITYENGTGYDKNVLARPYIKYTDANGLERVAYSEYRGKSNTLGGCYTSYKAVYPTP